MDKARTHAFTEERFMQHIAAMSKIIFEKQVHPQLVYNCDETMVDVSDRKSPKVITLREYSKVYKKTTETQPTHITLIATIA